ncbi:hypothetical protein [Aurantimonas sp. VKM B-3413]|uniref:hypothetical protein n=1 Tax=Aurantimonas sp. VKM B-3413 TaxID=2779401 RepID=UPI001E581301|nr:hypothetical protein [Aurantimonas sp. VKM B-3413]MCB8838089.1 hypothetical protein [Aurantimonas sp. VKM B-3413]
MARRYKLRNPQRKWSKLTPEQTTAIYTAYFRPYDTVKLTRRLSVSRRTIRSQFAVINRRLREEPLLRQALASELAPELRDFVRLFEVEDLSAGSGFWPRLHFCLLHCPAEYALNRSHELYRVVEAHVLKWGDKGEMGDFPIIMRMKCYACPIEVARSLLDSTAFNVAQRVLRETRQASVANLQATFLRATFEAAIWARTLKSGGTPGESWPYYKTRQAIISKLVAILLGRVS